MVKLSQALERSKKLFTKSRIFTFLLIFLLVVSLLVSYYFYNKYQTSKNNLNTLNSSSLGTGQEVENLKKNVGALIELPKGEEPTLATVSDKNKLNDQEFFKRAENGDKVLIYTKAKKAILYRPSANKIIEVAPVNLGNTQVATATATVTPTLKTYNIVLYNGTTTVGLTATVQQDLYSKTKEFNVVDRDNAFSNTYSDTLVIDFIGNATVAKNLVDFVGGRIASLPDGEKKPENADFLVILGADQNQ